MPIAFEPRKLSPRCPAATIVETAVGPSSVLCGVLAADRDEDRDSARESEDWCVFSVRDSPATVLGRCCSRYEACGIWVEDKKRIAEARSELKVPEAV